MARADEALFRRDIRHQAAQVHTHLVNRHNTIGIHITIFIGDWLDRGIGWDFDNKELAISYGEGIVGILKVASFLIERKLATESTGLDAWVGKSTSYRVGAFARGSDPGQP